MTQGDVCEYRGQSFRLEARHDGRVWTGHYHLLGLDARQSLQAGRAGRHQWTPIDPGWATRLEAESNAREAAHAAIDAQQRRALPLDE